MTQKTIQARAIIDSCRGKHGMWASSERYKHQCWTRDFCLATMEAVDTNAALQHLLAIAARGLFQYYFWMMKMPLYLIRFEPVRRNRRHKGKWICHLCCRVTYWVN
jgi:hypothetical protein